jgi:hypothetical protein
MWALIGGGVLFLAGGGVALYFLWPKAKDNTPVPAPQTPKPGSTPGWEADPEFVKNQLQADHSLPGFTIRPPEKFSFSHLIGSPVYSWKGPKPFTGLAPSLWVKIEPLPPEDEASVSLKKRGKKFLADYRARFKEFFPDLTTGPLESGQLDGVPFVRAKLKGSHSKFGKMHGFCYLTVLGKNLVSFESQAYEPNHVLTLKMTESAVLTFKKKK